MKLIQKSRSLTEIRIPINSTRLIVGEPFFGEWNSGDQFSYERENYTFLGVDMIGGLHARKDKGGLRVFESASSWVLSPVKFNAVTKKSDQT